MSTQQPAPNDDGDLTPETDDAVGHDGILDRLRKSAVGTNDPNIVGDAGPLDIPPGHDLDVPPDQMGPAGLPLLPPDEADTAVV